MVGFMVPRWWAHQPMSRKHYSTAREH